MIHQLNDETPDDVIIDMVNAGMIDDKDEAVQLGVDGWEWDDERRALVKDDPGDFWLLGEGN